MPSESSPADGDGDIVSLPRTKAGPQPQRLLLTVLGDYWMDQDRPLPSAALVQILKEFEVTPYSARTALSRLYRRGLLTPSRNGRNTAYELSEQGKRILRNGAPRMLGFGREDQEWDGTWLFLAFSVPEERRNVRPTLRKRLRWAGFAPLYDGLWVSPYASSEQVAQIVEELKIDSCAIIRGTTVSGLPGFLDPSSAWDLKSVRDRYNEFIDEFTDLRDRTRSGQVGPTEALVSRTKVTSAWRDFPELDPDLPMSLLPADWPRREARDLFVEVYDSLGALAAIRVRQVIGRFDPELAALAAHHATDFIPASLRR